MRFWFRYQQQHHISTSTALKISSEGTQFSKASYWCRLSEFNAPFSPGLTPCPVEKKGGSSMYMYLLLPPPRSSLFCFPTLTVTTGRRTCWTTSRLSFVTIVARVSSRDVVHVLLAAGGRRVPVGVRAAVLRLRRASEGTWGVSRRI